MSARQRYRTAAAFRAALEQRLRVEAQTSTVPLSRLRKEAAFNRLLARLRDAAPETWALKGGLALIARVGVHLRGTKDADANWLATRQELEETLLAVTDLDLDDWFTCEIGDGRPLVGEGEEGALRYPVTIKLDGRVFEQLSLDVNVVGSGDPRPLELVRVQRNQAAPRSPPRSGRPSRSAPLTGHPHCWSLRRTGPSPGRGSSPITRCNGAICATPSSRCSGSGVLS